MTTWIIIGLQTVLVLGALAAVHARIMARLTVLETRQDERDRNAAQREELYDRRTRDAFEAWCRSSCPRRGTGNTNPAIPICPPPEGV